MNVYILTTAIILFFIITTNSNYGRMSTAVDNKSVYKLGRKDFLQKDRYQWFAIVIIGIILVIITGLRSSRISEDYQHYSYVYGSVVRNLSWGEVLIYREPLFRLLLKIIGEVSNYNTVFLMLALSVITVSLFLRYFYKEAVYPVFMVFLLFTIGSYITSFNTTRQFLSAALFTIAFKYACQRDLKRYLLAILLIALVHNSVLLMLPFYWLLNIEWKKVKHFVWSIIVVVFAVVFIISARSIVGWLASIYYLSPVSSIQELFEGEISPLNIVRPAIIFAIALFFRSKISFNEAGDNCLFNSSLFFFIFYLFSYRITLFMRFTYFFIPGSLILIDRLLDRMNQSNRRIVFLVLVLFSIAWCSFGMFRNEYLFYWQ